MRTIRLFVAALCLLSLPLFAQDASIAKTRPNVKVLKEVTEYELFLEMNILADALGVHCDYCHVKAGTKWMWADDSKPSKAKGLQMISMTRGLNESNFHGANRVTCYTCHRGSLDPARIVPNPPLEVEERTGHRPVETLPTAQQVLAHYMTAVGAPAEAKAVHMSGTIDRSEGRKDTFDLSMRGDEKAHMELKTADGVVEQTLDGKTASIRVKDKLTDLTGRSYDRVKDSFAMYAPVKVRDSVDQLKVIGTEVIDGRKTYVVRIGTDEAVKRNLYFDATSGLLVRKLTIRETSFLPLLDQIDFSDYRDAGGIKVPFVIVTSDGAPYDTATRRMKEVKFESD